MTPKNSVKNFSDNIMCPFFKINETLRIMLPKSGKN